MPKAMEEALTKEAIRRGLKGEEINHFVFGTMQNKGKLNKKSTKKTKKKR